MKKLISTITMNPDNFVATACITIIISMAVAKFIFHVAL